VKEVGGRVSDEMSHKVVADVPGDVVKLLTPPLTFNVSNLLTDALTASVSKSLIASITQEFGADLAAGISAPLLESLYDTLEPFLQRAIPEKIKDVIPYLMERSLPISLTKSVTRALTHSLVPTLSHALSASPGQEVWCYYCFYKHLYCNYCHESAQSTYYTQYYANYYSDFYTDYYTPYYAKALTDLDKTQHPPMKQEEAKKHNSGEDLAKGQHPDASFRPVTAAGGRLGDDGVV
jgi:hypothetical protein